MLSAIEAGGYAEAWRPIEPQPEIMPGPWVRWQGRNMGDIGEPWDRGWQRLADECPFGKVGDRFDAAGVPVIISAVDVTTQGDGTYYWHITLHRAPPLRRRAKPSPPETGGTDGPV
jgi:hypothetical protein